MKAEILFLAHRVPYPPDRGDKIRSWNVLKGLAKIAPVHVAALCDDPADLDHADMIASVAKSVELVPLRTSRLGAMTSALLTGSPASVKACASSELMSHVQTKLGSAPVAAIYAFSGQMAQFVPCATGDARFIMDFVDMDSAKFEGWGRERNGLDGFANRMEGKRLFAFEREVAARANMSLFVSEAEAQLFREKTGLGAGQVRALENGIDLDRFSPRHAGRAERVEGKSLIVFTGQMDYAPNVEAVSWFAHKVLPGLPDAHFAIVGRAPTLAVQALEQLPNVTVTGAVDDTRDWIASADLVVAPLLLARGIQNKVLEAMAMAKAVVLTPPAAEGIDALDGRDFVVADGAAAQVKTICDLLAVPDRLLELGGAARVRMEQRYGWDACLAGLPAILGMKL